jgi:hypothetical protein
MGVCVVVVEESSDNVEDATVEVASVSVDVVSISVDVDAVKIAVVGGSVVTVVAASVEVVRDCNLEEASDADVVSNVTIVDSVTVDNCSAVGVAVTIVCNDSL